MLLKRKIPIAIISLVSLPLIFLSIMVYTYTSHTLIEISKNRIRNISQIETENLSNIISAQKTELQLTARMSEIIDVLVIDSYTPLEKKNWVLKKEANDILKTNLTHSPGLQNVFLINKEGMVLLSANDEYLQTNVGDNEYFIEAMKGKTVITNTIVADSKEQNIIIMATPVKNSDDKVIGVLINSLKLEYFKYKIGKLKMENQGYAYIVDADGIIVAHPDSDEVGTYVENEAVNNVVSRIKNKEPILVKEGTYTYRGIKKYMAYGVIPDINWLFVFVQNQSEMNEPALFVLLLIIMTTLTFLILSVITSMKFSKSITKPIDKLMESMDKAANGDLSSQCNFKSKDEFGRLAMNFNIMVSQLNLSYEELTSIYEELAATEEELRAQYEDLQVNEEYLRKSEEKYKLALEGANDVIWEWDSETKVFYVSDKWRDIVGGLPSEQLSVKKFMQLVHSEDAETVMSNIKEHITQNTEFYKSEFRIKGKDNNYKWILARGKALRNRQGKIIKVAGSITDISERKEIENQVKYMAYYDMLTKLPNRSIFMERLNTELHRAKKRAMAGAVMFIDLDNFKNVNDTLGHDFGDELLEQIAKKVQCITKKNNLLCRFGGDEFLVLQPNIKDKQEVVSFTKEILDIFQSPFLVKDKLIYSTASIGISVYPEDGESTSVLLKNADTAMYKAKSLGKNSYAFFNHEMYHGLERKIKIQSIMRQALIDNSFELYYQPQVDVKYKTITGFEALLRLYSKEMGFISPMEFIPIAEESGIIKEIGAWCLRSACLKNKEWRDKGYTFESIAVNISAVQFEQSNFIEMIKNVLSEVELKPEFLEIEITETVLMQSLEKNIEILEKLREIGIKIALDDFGTGYSSLSYLRRLPIHTLKIDKSFIDEISSSPKEQAIADGIIQLAHQMELEVVAEGVENQYQLELLEKKSCDKVQGYLFSKPLPAADAEELIKNFNLYENKQSS